MTLFDHFDEPRSARGDRLEARLRKLGTRTPRCLRPGCGETNPRALQGVHPDVVCYACAAIEAGRSGTEEHHIAGRRNADDTVSLAANDHRVLSDLQRDWPPRTLQNPDDSPLLRAAAALRGWLDVLVLVVERAVEWVPPFLEWLDERLCERLGADWWTTLGWDG